MHFCGFSFIHSSLFFFLSTLGVINVEFDAENTVLNLEHHLPNPFQVTYEKQPHY